MIEGYPIHIAGQEKEIKKAQKDNPKGNNHDYRPDEIHVDTYGKIIDEFKEKVM